VRPRASRRGAALAALAAALGAGCALRGAPAWEQPPPPIRTGPVVDASRLHRAELANGLRVIVFEDPRLPELVLGLAVRRGAAQEPLERAGLATFTAELMTRGAGARDALALAQVVDDLGASLDASADFDETAVVARGLSRDADTLFGVLADVVRRPRFEPAEAEKVRRELLAVLEQQKDSPALLARNALTRALYDGHRFGAPVLGTPEAVATLDAAAAAAFHRVLFVPGNAVLFATGDVRFPDVLARAQAAFGDWPEAPPPELPFPPPSPAPPSRRVVIVDRPDVVQAQIAMGHEGMARSDPARIPALLMNDVLGGGGFTSRLMARVRAEAGLTYGANSWFALRRAPGPFVVATFTRVPEARRTVDLVLAEIERTAREPLAREELESARRLAAGGFALGLETAADVTEALVDLDVQGLPADSLDTYRDRVLAATLEDVQRAARERLHPERAAIVVVGPAEQLRPALEGLGAIEVVQP
jgi:zinc protease